jgi:hypothetical protein
MTKVLERCRAANKIYVGEIKKNDGESHFDFFTRILEPSYDKNSGCFYIIPSYSCSLSERDNVIGEFERDGEKLI